MSGNDGFSRQDLLQVVGALLVSLAFRAPWLVSTLVQHPPVTRPALNSFLGTQPRRTGGRDSADPKALPKNILKSSLPRVEGGEERGQVPASASLRHSGDVASLAERKTGKWHQAACYISADCPQIHPLREHS